MRVLVLGGYGNFGQVIVRAIAVIAGVEVWVAGRDQGKARALAEAVGGQGVALDIGQPALAQRLRELGADLVISTVGPFQGQDYRVAEACMNAGAHYIDLADARDFVCGISRLDQAAREAGVLLCSGASSVPALSAAVVDSLLPRFARLDGIEHGISSSEKTPGLSTLQAVLSYCGKAFRQWRAGRWQTVYGWQEPRRHAFRSPMGPRWMVNCDVPDLELFPQRYPSVQTVRFSAGVGLRLTQFGTWMLSWLVRSRLLPTALPLAPLLRGIAQRLEPLGDGYSGMFVELTGTGTDGQPLRLCWELLALGNDGPNIPCMAAVALVRKMAMGQLEHCGARPCLGLLSVEEYLAELAGFAISVELRQA